MRKEKRKMPVRITGLGVEFDRVSARIRTVLLTPQISLHAIITARVVD